MSPQKFDGSLSLFAYKLMRHLPTSPPARTMAKQPQMNCTLSSKKKQQTVSLFNEKVSLTEELKWFQGLPTIEPSTLRWHMRIWEDEDDLSWAPLENKMLLIQEQHRKEGFAGWLDQVRAGQVEQLDELALHASRMQSSDQSSSELMV